MNKLNSYILLDKQAQAFNTPMFLANDAVAIRSIKNELKNPNSQISLSPEDFAIYKNGIYDTATGKFEPITEPVEAYDNEDNAIHVPYEESTIELVIEVKDIQLPEDK